VRARPGEVGEHARVVPVAARLERRVQVDERHPGVRDEEPVGQEQGAGRAGEEAHREPPRPRLVLRPGAPAARSASSRSAKSTATRTT
jgi:hypothetical protein